MSSNNSTSQIEAISSTASTTTAISAHPEEQFVGFVKESVGFIVALTASMPLLADYFKLVALPYLTRDPIIVNDKLLPLIATLASSVIFLAFFWTRDNLRTIYWLSAGIFLFLVGIALLTYQQIVLHTYGEDIRLFKLSSIFATASDYEAVIYLLGFVGLVAGIAIVFLYGFVRHQERLATMQQIIPQLDREQWELLLQEARLQMEINDALSTSVIQPEAQDPLKASIALLYRQHIAMLKGVSWGSLDQIRGPAMDDIMRLFTQKIKKQFRALSKDDLDFWAKPESKKYLALNKQMLKEAKVPVERIFLLSHKNLSKEHQETILQQIHMGIHVYLCLLENAKKAWEDENDLDFGLLDEYAVSFWRFGQGRFFRISTSTDIYKKYDKIYEDVKTQSIRAPTTTRKFEEWAEQWWSKEHKAASNKENIFDNSTVLTETRDRTNNKQSVDEIQDKSIQHHQ